jgi:hypothetical protein
MKKLFLYFLMLMAFTATSAQTYIVYRVSGNVTIGSNNQTPKVGEKLQPETMLFLAQNATLQLVCPEQSLRCVLNTPGKATLKSMLDDTQNNLVTKVTKQHLDYMLEQTVEGSKKANLKNTNVASLAREMQQRQQNKAGGSDWRDNFDDNFENSFGTDFDSEYQDFCADAQREFDDFRDSVNYVYAEFMKKAWAMFDSKPGEKKPADQKIKPVVTTEDNTPKPQTDRFLFFGKKKVVKTPKPEPQHVPIAQVKEDEDDQDDTTVSCHLWGTDFTVHFNPKNRFRLKDSNASTISDAWVSLSAKKYNRLLRDCLDIRFDKQLGDWAYLLLLEEIGKVCMGEGNEATLLSAYLYCQSGYRMRLGKDGNKLLLLYASKHQIYDQDYYSIGGLRYYVLGAKANQLAICNVPYPDEHSMTLMLSTQQKLKFLNDTVRTITSNSRPYPSVTAKISVNRHLIEFYDKYPSSIVDNNFMTRWAMYANTPLEDEVKQQLYPPLREAIKGLPRLEAVNRLLRFIQQGFVYEYDDKVWGGDRPFFAEETLFYPFCDCEDRAILFSRLVRDLVGLPVVLVYYPGHLAAAVRFDESDQAKGAYYLLDNDKYYVADPTITGYGAEVGVAMDVFNKPDVEVSLILLNND